MAISPGGRPADDTPVGTPGGRQNWVDKAGGLPKYIRMVAHALMRKGMSKDRAIPTAVNRIKRWAAGLDNVRPQVQAAAAAALAEWNAKKGMSLSTDGYVDAFTIDLAAYDELVAIVDASLTYDLSTEYLEAVVDQYGGTVIDLAAPREYVRDGVGKFAIDANKGKGKKSQAEKDKGDDEKPASDKGTGPKSVKAYKVDTLADIRALMRSWRTVPLGTRAALRSKIKAKARTLDAPERMLALIDGLGDGTKKHAGREGAGKALRDDKAGAWLKAAGFKLATEDPTVPPDTVQVLDLAGNVVASANLDGNLSVNVLDLAPGDYSPPYDWKHGYIPLTAAAAASKAGKGPHVGKGRTKTPKGKRITASSVKKTAAKQAKAAPRAKPTPREINDAVDVIGETRASQIAPNGIGNATEAQHRRILAEADRAKVAKPTQTGHSGGMNPTGKPSNVTSLDSRRKPDPWGDKAPKKPDDMTAAELKTERDRMDNIIKGRAGGTASDEDVARWTKRRNDAIAALNRKTQAEGGPVAAPQSRGDRAAGKAPSVEEARQNDDKLRASGHRIGSERFPGWDGDVSSDGRWELVRDGKRWHVNARTARNDHGYAARSLSRKQAREWVEARYEGNPGPNDRATDEQRARIEKARGNVTTMPAPTSSPEKQRAAVGSSAFDDADMPYAERLAKEHGGKPVLIAATIKKARDDGEWQASVPVGDGKRLNVNVNPRQAPKSTGIDAPTAERMSDDQLEKAMQRLMDSGTYSGPAFAVIEKELDKRDKARAGKAPRR